MGPRLAAVQLAGDVWTQKRDLKLPCCGNVNFSCPG